MNDVGGGIGLLVRLHRFDWGRSVDLGVHSHLLIAADAGRGVVTFLVMVQHWQVEVLFRMMVVLMRVGGDWCLLVGFVRERGGCLELDAHLLDFID